MLLVITLGHMVGCDRSKNLTVRAVSHNETDATNNLARKNNSFSQVGRQRARMHGGVSAKHLASGRF